MFGGLCQCVCRFLLEPCGVDTGNGVELGDAALGGRVKALRLSAHLKEHFLFLHLPGKLFLQGLRNTHEIYASYADSDMTGC